MPGIQVLIVDPHQIPREGLRFLLAGDRYDVIGATSSPEAALADIEAGGRPNLLIVVLRDSGETFQSATLQLIRTIVPECKIVLIASTIASSLPARVSGWGANALLRSDMSKDILTRSLHLVMQGQAIFPASSSMHPNNHDESTGDAAEIAASSRMSGGDGRILQHLVSGHSNKMIAIELGISHATVKVHMKAIMQKLNVHSRMQAALWAATNCFSKECSSGFPLPAVHSQPAGPADRRAVELAA
jgi:two-component system nitrate/nitrite response regulator NarL